MEKIMLIAGCSHAAGSEIDGTEDSVYNRQHSFGALLAVKMGHRPINIAMPGAANLTVARSILQWFDEEYDPKTMEVFVLISWTESSRMELPDFKGGAHRNSNIAIDWFPEESQRYSRVTFGSSADLPEEQLEIKQVQRFMADHLEYLEINSALMVLLLQSFLENRSVRYCMCDTGIMFSDNVFIKFYLNQMDHTHYMNMGEDERSSFYWKYKNAGYTNPKAKYWHHGEEPHALYANDLHRFILNK